MSLRRRDANDSGDGPRTGPRAALGDRGFRGWFLTQAVSSSGTTVQLVAQSWLVAQHTHSGTAIALLTVATFGPFLLLSPLAGSMLDRRSTRNVLLVTQTAYLVLAIALVGVVAVGVPTWSLYVFAALNGAVNAYDNPARQVYGSELVPARLLSSAVGLTEVIINASRVIGPAVGSVLLVTAGPLACFAANAVSFIPLLVLLVRTKPLTIAQTATRTDEPESTSAATGFRFVARAADLRAVILLAGCTGMLFNLNVTVPLLTTSVFGAPAAAFGFVNSVFGVGAIAGALVAAFLAVSPKGPELRRLALVTGAAVVLSAAAPNLILFCAGLTIAGISSIWFVARANSYVLLRAPVQLRGRVMSVWNAALPGSGPVTALLTGALTDLVGPRAGFALSGALLLLGMLLFWAPLGRFSRPVAGSV